jgi:hypothetical protein
MVIFVYFCMKIQNLYILNINNFTKQENGKSKKA